MLRICSTKIQWMKILMQWWWLNAINIWMMPIQYNAHYIGNFTNNQKDDHHHHHQQQQRWRIATMMMNYETDDCIVINMNKRWRQTQTSKWKQTNRTLIPIFKSNKKFIHHLNNHHYSFFWFFVYLFFIRIFSSLLFFVFVYCYSGVYVENILLVHNSGGLGLFSFFWVGRSGWIVWWSGWLEWMAYILSMEQYDSFLENIFRFLSKIIWS